MQVEALFNRDGRAHTGAVLQDEKGKPFYEYQPLCSRCGGAGGSDKWKFTGWTCFECGGGKLGPIRTAKLYTAEQLAKLNATQAKANAKRAEKAAAEAAARETARQARHEAFIQENGDLLAKAQVMCQDNAFALDVIETVTRNSAITENQRAALLKAIAEAERKAATQHIGDVGTRQVFTGELVTVYKLESYNKLYASRYLQIVRTELGTVKYIGTAYLGTKGERVTFKATIAGHEEYKGEKQTIVERPKLEAAA